MSNLSFMLTLLVLLIADVFNSFKDERGSFKACLCEDTKGMLSLYEASFLLIEGENILEEAKDFSTKHLEEYTSRNKDKNLAVIINHSLELPLHWRMFRAFASVGVKMSIIQKVSKF